MPHQYDMPRARRAAEAARRGAFGGLAVWRPTTWMTWTESEAPV
jgi:hypothetical protein